MISKEMLRELYLELCAQEGAVPDTEQADYLWMEFVHDLKTMTILEES